MEHKKRYLRLFAVNLYISAFTFGGGYVVIPMIRKFFVEKYHDFEEEELMEMAAVAQSSPGAIAVNLAVLAGYRMEGIAGACISCVAAILPPLVILSIVSTCYEAFRQNPVIAVVLKGMQAGVAAVILDLVLDMGMGIWKQKEWLLTCLMAVVFLSNLLFEIPIGWILLLCCAVCAADGYLREKKRRQQQCGKC